VIKVISISPRVQSLSVAMILLLYKLDYTIEVSMLVAAVENCYSDWSYVFLRFLVVCHSPEHTRPCVLCMFNNSQHTPSVSADRS